MSQTQISYVVGGQKRYCIDIDYSCKDAIAAYLGRRPRGSKVLLISDSNVYPLAAPDILALCEQAGLQHESFVIPAGESSKSLAQAEELYAFMADRHYGRDTLVCSLGGGVVSDLAGFVAATYMRGLTLISIPTSLLAMVDASVGGKTAVNTPYGKNMVGVFNQPERVFISAEYLASLPQDEYASGMVEAVKSALLMGGECWDFVCTHAESLSSFNAEDPQAILGLISYCVAFKASVVERDEQELQGERMCLNYGHTLGHALEKILGYGTISHGQAVLEGMYCAELLAQSAGLAQKKDTDFYQEIIARLGLRYNSYDLSAQELIDAMRFDKKQHAGQIRFVCLKSPGEWCMYSPDTSELMSVLTSWCKQAASIRDES